MNDELKLVKKAKQGDQHAFGKLVQQYQNKILYLAFDLVGNYTDAQDIAQNTFLQAFKNIAYFRDEASFSTWIYRIATNAAIDFQRSRKRRRQIFINQSKYEDEDSPYLENIADPDVSIIKNLEDHDLKKLIADLVGQLSPQQRAAFMLKFFHDKKTDEIAEIINCNPATVRGHLLRATTKLRKMLKDER